MYGVVLSFDSIVALGFLIQHSHHLSLPSLWANDQIDKQQSSILSLQLVSPSNDEKSKEQPQEQNGKKHALSSWVDSLGKYYDLENLDFSQMSTLAENVRPNNIKPIIPRYSNHHPFWFTEILAYPIDTTSQRSFSKRLLQQQSAETSNALIEMFTKSPLFVALANYEGDLTVKRDQEDAKKLQRGIDYAISKGVIDGNYIPEPYYEIDVLGKTPDDVADEIISHIQASKQGANSSEADSEGSIIVICGLSGTGKGTTVAKICQKLQENEGKKVVTWSNGNIFRSITLLAVTWSEQQQQFAGEQGILDKDNALTKENLERFMSMLTFGKYNGKYDTRIHGLGLDMLVSEAENTELKGPKVARNIPAVAEYIQGEVIVFAANAVETMRKDGWFILVEGREQTVNYVRTPHRFTLTLSDPSLIGKRRAAQRLMAHALSRVTDADTDETVYRVLHESLAELANDLPV